jgi:mycothiol system anti-sigma-R factor
LADGPVDWHLARRVAVRAAGREPFAESYLAASLQRDFEEATAEAEALVAEATGLRSLAGPARARVTDRSGWVSANVGSFQRLLRPLIDKLEGRTGNLTGAVASRVAAVEVGMLLGWMSQRVLGQYDLLSGELDDDRRSQIRAHLDECAPCAEPYDFYAEVRRCLQQRCQDQAPPDLLARIEAAIQAE